MAICCSRSTAARACLWAYCWLGVACASSSEDVEFASIEELRSADGCADDTQDTSVDTGWWFWFPDSGEPAAWYEPWCDPGSECPFLDGDIDGDGIVNGLDADADGDGIVNEIDTDADGDGHLDNFMPRGGLSANPPGEPCVVRGVMDESQGGCDGTLLWSGLILWGFFGSQHARRPRRPVRGDP